ncbi:hypothetical protein GCG21_12490 [Pseudactinotalea sp. HY160]|uniref:FUSC family protein n=1 Tax=Pseudactinotalea sp. HY160 TaxID=2654490 RepID=UPI00128B1285|nr:FUSC family protein [Pseudactinotalea sp. HY160]MPV50812.1 hypothetical protein [Pseudactinotalea sp. HY160]
MTISGEPEERLDRRRLLVLARQHARQGRRRVRSAALPVLVAAVAAGVAWAVAHYGLGHEQPFFAPIAAWVCLGFSPSRQIRKVAELAIGVTLGVALGELIAAGLGTGPVQIAVVIVVAALLARFVDRGAMLTVQAGVQGIVIVALPVISATGGAAGRWLDALIGGGFALLVAALTPGDAQRRARQLARASTSDLAQLLRLLARGVATGDEQPIRDALIAGRATQGVLDEWSEVVRNARQSVRISPASRHYQPELADLQHANLFADRAMRNARVIARRGVTAMSAGGDERISAWLTRIAEGTEELGRALGSGTSTLPARETLAGVAGRLAPQRFDEAGWRLQTLVIIMRSLTVDLLQATGLSSQSATALLARDEPPPAD